MALLLFVCIEPSGLNARHVCMYVWINCFFIQYHLEPFHFPTGQLPYYCNNTLAFIAFYLFSDVN